MIETIIERINDRKDEILAEQKRNNWCDLEGAWYRALGELTGLNFVLQVIGEEQ